MNKNIIIAFSGILLLYTTASGQKGELTDKKLTPDDFKISSYEVNPGTKLFYIFDYGTSTMSYPQEVRNGNYPIPNPKNQLTSYRYFFKHRIRLFIADPKILADTTIKILLMENPWPENNIKTDAINIKKYFLSNGKVKSTTIEKPQVIMQFEEKLYISLKELESFFPSAGILDIDIKIELPPSGLQGWTFGNEKIPVLLSRYETKIPHDIIRDETLNERTRLTVDNSETKEADRIYHHFELSPPKPTPGFAYEVLPPSEYTQYYYYKVFMLVSYDYRTMQSTMINPGEKVSSISYIF